MVNTKILNIAIEIASSHPDRDKACRCSCHGAVMFRAGRVIAKAYNTERSTAFGCVGLSSMHAECGAILRGFGGQTTKKLLSSVRLDKSGNLKPINRALSLNLSRRLSKVSLLVVRVDRMDNLADSKPCPICALLMKASGAITKIYYSTASGKIKQERVTKLTFGSPSSGLRRIMPLLPSSDPLARALPEAVKTAALRRL